MNLPSASPAIHLLAQARKVAGELWARRSLSIARSVASSSAARNSFSLSYSSEGLPTQRKPRPRRAITTPSRCIQTAAIARRSSQPKQPQQAALSGSIKALMRASAQPVALVTCYLSSPSPSSSTISSISSRKLVHGATLSSFSSISLSPPLVSFSIKTPSRLADAILSSSSPPSVSNEASPGLPSTPQFVVNLLEQHQAELAAAFARPGIESFAYDYDATTSSDAKAAATVLSRTPTSSSSSQTSHPFERHGIFPCHEADGVPVVDGALGAMTCSVVDSLRLGEYAVEGEGEEQGGSESVLFIARVHSVLEGTGTNGTALPLIYCDRRFTTVRDGGESGGNEA